MRFRYFQGGSIALVGSLMRFRYFQGEGTATVGGLGGRSPQKVTGLWYFQGWGQCSGLGFRYFKGEGNAMQHPPGRIMFDPPSMGSK